MLDSVWEPPILTTHQRGALPTPARLEQVALHLAAKGDHRSLIALVERWAGAGDPTVPARLAEARSFVELRMLDRAWVRLKDLVEAETPNLDALVVAAEMFLLRGWPNKAKKAALRGLEQEPTHTVLRGLSERAHDSPTQPDDGAVEAEATPIAELVRVAEQFMSQGAFVKARTLLERVRRKVPDHRWAADLLWAIEGDFTAGDQTLADLCERLGPDLQLVADLSDEPEHTESARMEDVKGLQVEPDTERGFPALFRNLEGGKTEAWRAPTRSDPPEREVTAVSSMAEVADLRARATDPGSDRTDPHADDTQIVRVINKADGAQADTAVDASFNLADFRRQMGVDTPDLARDYVAGPEDEDDSVVILTRREDSTDGRETPTDVGKVVQIETATEKAAKESRGGVEDAGWARASHPAGQSPASAPTPPAAQRLAASTRTPVPAARSTAPPQVRARTVVGRQTVAPPMSFAWPWWVFVLSTVLFLCFVMFVVIAVVFLLG